MLNEILRTVGFFLLMVAPVPAQTTTAAQTAEPAQEFLVRVERSRFKTVQCVLVRADGQYFAARSTDKSKTYEGRLDTTAMASLRKDIESAAAIGIPQAPPRPSTDYEDILVVNLFLDGKWRNLRFPTPESRESYKNVLTPFMRLLESSHEAETANSKDPNYANCVPSGTLKVEKNDAKRVGEWNMIPRPQPTRKGPFSFVLVVDERELTQTYAQSTCMILYKTGKFHIERLKQTQYGVGDTEAVEGNVAADEVSALKALLDEDKLRAKQDEILPQTWRIGDGTITLYVIDRGEKLQALTIWQLTNALNQGSMAGVTRVIDNGSDLVKPVRKWMKSNLKGGTRVTLVNHCDPV